MGNNMVVSHELKHRITMWSRNSPSGCITKACEAGPWRDAAHLCFYNAIQNSQKLEMTHVSVEEWMDKIKRGTDMNRISSPLKRRSDMVQCKVENVKCNKPKWNNKKTNISWFCLCEVLTIVKFIETESKMEVIRGWGEGLRGSYYLTSTEF